MYLTVGVLTILAAIGGGFQFAGVWTTISDWLEPVAKPLVEASNTQEAIASVAAVAVGLAGIAVAWWIYSARRAHAPRPSRCWSGSSTSTSSTTGSSTGRRSPSRNFLYWAVEGPLVSGSIRGVTDAARWAGSRTRAPPDRVRPLYVLALAAGVTILNPRPSWPCDDRTWLDHQRPDPAAAGGRVAPSGSCRLPRVWIAPTALLIALFEIGFWIEALSASTSTGRPPGVEPPSWLKDLCVSYHVGHVRGLHGLARRPDGRRPRCLDRVRLWSRRRRPRAYYGLMLFLTARSSVSSPRRISSSSTSSGRRC